MQEDIYETIRTLNVNEVLERGGSRLAAVLGHEVDFLTMTPDDIKDILEKMAEHILRMEKAQREAAESCERANHKADSMAADLQKTRSELRKVQARADKSDKDAAAARAEAADLRARLEASEKGREEADRELGRYKDYYRAYVLEKYVASSQKSSRSDDGADDKGKREHDGFDGSDEAKAAVDAANAPAEEKPAEDRAAGEKRKDPDGSDSPAPKAPGAKPDNRPRGKGSKGGRGAYKLKDVAITYEHPNDDSQLPEGAVVISRHYEDDGVVDIKIQIACHCKEIVEYELDGVRHTAHFEHRDPMKAMRLREETDPEKARRQRELLAMYSDDQANLVPFKGTSITPRAAAILTLLSYWLCVPANRLCAFLRELGFSYSRGCTYNWLQKGADDVEPSIEALKEMALEKDSIVNCDETWCKVRKQVQGTGKHKYKKCYVWVLVNKAKRIVVFFYDSGSRGRKVLQDFIGDAEISALQSDGYAAYAYLNGSGRIEHIDCMAHLRAKLKRAADAGDPIAKILLELVNELFGKEAEYKRLGLSPDEIFERRNDAETTRILGDIYSMAKAAYDDKTKPKSALLLTALKYLLNQWNELVAYRKDGRYEISNNLAEREVRPLTLIRSGSKTFGSDHGVARVSNCRSMISTCLNLGRSVFGYFYRLFVAKTQSDEECRAITVDYLFGVC